ncbi:hypothetical protein ACQ3G6_02740 [Allorhizobium undicola]|uniref:hypothetical protein n=1 Tax=Allorhizobium undicola TaxID=78527 RepID=UPI003D33FC34
MKGLLGKVRFSRKMVIILGGVLVACGASGSVAVYIGRDQLLGASKTTLNGLECTQVQAVKLHRKERVWVRKYVTTEPGDGLSRIRTALRVAKATAEAEKADLVQVVVLDKNGPKDRAEIRGRAVGAEVVYVPVPAHIDDEQDVVPLTARYVDRPANGDGDFYGERIDMASDEAAALMASLTEKNDCVIPAPPADKEGDGHGKASGHGKTEKATGEHGQPEHGKTEPDKKEHGADGHGADGHGAEAKKDGEAAGSGDAAHGGEPPAADAKPGLISSIKGMIFGSEKPAGTETALHTVSGEAAPTAPAHDSASAEKVGGDAEKPADGPAPAGWFASLKSRILGSDRPADPGKPAEQADASKPATEPEKEEPASVLPKGISLR